MIGLALITTVNVLGATMRASVDKQVDAQFGADYLVQAEGAGGVGAEVAQKIGSTPGVTAASPTYEGDAKIAGKKASYMSGDVPAIVKGAKLDITSGGTSIGGTGMMVDEKTAEDNGWKVGTAVPVQFTDGKTERLTVTGVYAKSDLIGSRIISQQAYLRHTVKPSVDVIVVDAAAPSAATKTAIESTLKGYPNLKVSDQASLKEDARKQIDGFVTFLTILLVMSVIIAAVGVINTLALSVIERTREIGLLRAIGISRRQLRRMVRLESIMIAVFGAALGMGIGVAFGAALQNALADQGLGVLAVPYGTLLVYLVVAAVIGVLAALWRRGGPGAWTSSRRSPPSDRHAATASRQAVTERPRRERPGPPKGRGRVFPRAGGTPGEATPRARRRRPRRRRRGRAPPRPWRPRRSR
ncbi:ABC transporter permease [Actinomadura madurae]|uniref:ABC transporter permease n=1 Tax=Actinomadura madurae TaxID=1993 RepID=UPI0020D23958|nr:ABC transporter permease [Actinomadura madurae]MCP9977077.1 ABC transporter permease [Actinomadura madurae]